MLHEPIQHARLRRKRRLMRQQERLAPAAVLSPNLRYLGFRQPHTTFLLASQRVHRIRVTRPIVLIEEQHAVIWMVVGTDEPGTVPAATVIAATHIGVFA